MTRLFPSLSQGSEEFILPPRIDIVLRDYLHTRTFNLPLLYSQQIIINPNHINLIKITYHILGWDMHTFIGLNSIWAFNTPFLSVLRDPFIVTFGRDALGDVSWTPIEPVVS